MTALFVWGASLATWGLEASAAPPERPNIVVLFADDLGYGELGCQGNPQIPTPHIDSIARQGVRCTAGYVTAAYCSTSRAGLLTGRVQARFGYDFNPIGADNEDPRVGLPAGERTLAEVLQRAGYATGLVGKWHLGGTAAYSPLRRGFDEFFGFLHEGHYFLPPPYEGAVTMLRRRALPDGGEGRWISQDGRLVLSTHMRYHEPAYDANNPIVRGGQPVEEETYLTQALTREAVDFVERNAERPFFLYVAYNAVHSPLQGLEEDVARFSHLDDIHRQIFAAMLVQLDQSVGEILDAIDRKQLSRRTLVFFISDNGGPTRELTSSNLPLRGGKGELYEGGIRVPYLVQWPGQLPGGVTFEEPVSSLDVFTTAADVAGIELTNPERYDGVSLIPFLTGEKSGPPHHELYWRQGGKTAVRSGDWKLVRPRGGQQVPWELYNLSDDLGEKHDLAATHPDRLGELVDVWRRWDEQMVDAFWRRER